MSWTRTWGLMAMAALMGAAPLQAADWGTPAIEAVDASAMKGARRVAVASFTVQYVTSQVWDTSHTTGGGRTGILQTAGQGGGFDLGELLEPEARQATTEKLHAGFLAALQAAGFEVVGPEQLAASKAYQAYLANAPKTPRKEEAEAQKSNGAGAITSIFHTPPGVPMVLGDKFDHLSTGRLGSTVSDPTLTFAGRMGLYTTNWAYYDRDVQKELDAATLHVRLYVPLAHVQVASGSFWGSGYSRQGIEPGLRLGERLTRVTVGHKGEYTKLVLGEPFLIPGPIEARVEKVKHPNPVRAMMGEKIKIYPGTAYADRYWALMPEASSHVLKAFAEKLKDGV